MKTIYKKLLFLLLLLPFGMYAQGNLEGNVIDSKTSLPLSGVNVKVQNVSNGTITDSEGRFKLTKIKNGDVISFSSVGYKKQTIVFSNQGSVTIKLEEEANTLQEVVVQVGYGSVKKKDATGSVSVISAKDFNKGAIVTTENLLNGRVAGVTINSGGGAPGTGSTIRVRGGSSLFGSNDPLIVIDGLPIENNTDKNIGSTSILASINPSTIESISVLKDASATAIYGSRAASGVILITTKKGTKKLAVDYNFQYGSGSLVKKIDVFNADQYRSLIAQYRPLDVSKLGNANTDWQDEIYRRTDFVDNNISVRGNLFNAIPTRLTVGNTYQEGLRLTNSFNRTTAGLALNPTFFKDHLKVRLNANYTNEKNRFADGVEGSAIRFDPTQPVYDSTSIYGGFFEYYNHANGELTTQTPRNPVAQLLQTYDTGKNNRYYGNFELDYKFHFLPALRAVVNVGFDEANGERTKLVGTNAATAASNNNIPYGTNEYSESMRKNKLLDAYFVYNKAYNDFNFDVTAGYSYQKWDSDYYYSNNILNPTYTGPTKVVEWDRVLISYFGRSNINFKNKYLLTLTARADKSSKFDSSNRTGFFPGAAFAWKMKEDFFKNNNTISDMKLRLGVGTSGQQDVGNNNDYIQIYNLGNPNSQYYFGSSATAIAVSAKMSSGLKWETTYTYNAGIDYGLFNNRVTGSLDVYYKDSKNLIARVATADGSNFSNTSWQNIGSLSNRGVEFNVNFEAVKAENFNWNMNFNTSAYQRKIEELKKVSYIRVGENLAGTGTQGQAYMVGYAPFSYLVYKQLYDNAGKPIEGAYADLNGDGVINASDKYIYRNADPKVTFGFASNMNYKNLDFSFNLRASVGNRVFNQVAASKAQYSQLSTGNALGNIPTSVVDTNFNTTSDVVLSDLYVENGSFLRMDNITLGYTFPKWLEGKASLRLSAGCQNAFLITKYSGLDPEIGNNGVDSTIYPRQRQLLFGVNMKF
ncbi:iron complex outermembrane receptor protein [Flavobacterium croceum DSM 17960]|uniref:Iron complex outermembrane receptor protein n=1 Tax=Flavobacterium croceum DSM 17960 TaxID=1121886 RepID=A0A2S4NAD6_9FLAO|nr:SusC/RagA family TonB-linked outer membrane protein [Flavobacterium croceum]POS02657.1 iron complex outermembrane receptor protein [Flavobacterium croceum DSM 17960]